MSVRAPIALALVGLLACSKGDQQAPAPSPSGSATANAPGPRTKPKPSAGGPAGEVFHASDRRELQGFKARDLAVGGGWVYWIEQPRIDKHGLGKSVLRRKPTSGAGAPETVSEPGKLYAVAADAEHVYIVSGAVKSRPHAGGEWKELAPGLWLDVVPGGTHLLVRSREKLALVPKQGGAIETVWEGKRGKHAVAADGDRFFAIDTSSQAAGSAKRPIMRFEPGTKPEVHYETTDILDEGGVRGAIGIDGERLYFVAAPEAARTSPPLWFMSTNNAGKPEPAGSGGVGFGSFVIRNGALYGMIFDGKWRLQKAVLPHGKPVPIDALAGFSSMVQALAADDQHVYYLTDWDVKRAPL